MTNPFRNQFSESIFNLKYRHSGAETWSQLAYALADEVCADIVGQDTAKAIGREIETMRFIPGGRYLYYVGRGRKFYNNCLLMKAEEDSRQDWAKLSWQAESSLMTGAGIGIDYSVYREEGAQLSGTGGYASGPIPKMEMINEIGRRVMQGGSRRSAIYASLDWNHPDIKQFLKAKDWHSIQVPGTGVSLADVKAADFNWPAPLDMTNVSVNYKNGWLSEYTRTGDLGSVFIENVRQAMQTAEPGFSFNFGKHEHETLRNACTEVTSEDDSDICNLGSVNMSRIDTLDQFSTTCQLGTIFLLCGTLKAELPYDKVYKVREKNRRLGLGMMGMHEWLLRRGEHYSVTPELRTWLGKYRRVSDNTAETYARMLNISCPVATRAIAPTGSIGILAGTTTGIEPIFAVAYKRRYLSGKSNWRYQYVVDSMAQEIIEQTGIDPDKIESALSLASDFERRVRFQADVQDFVDMAISSTVNLPAWGSEFNNEDTVTQYAEIIAYYARRLRGLTVYPDGARGGQPLTPVSYKMAKANLGQEFEEAVQTHDICDISGKGGTCGS